MISSPMRRNFIRTDQMNKISIQIGSFADPEHFHSGPEVRRRKNEARCVVAE